jgi:hypothetical protein
MELTPARPGAMHRPAGSPPRGAPYPARQLHRPTPPSGRAVTTLKTDLASLPLRGRRRPQDRRPLHRGPLHCVIVGVMAPHGSCRRRTATSCGHAAGRGRHRQTEAMTLRDRRPRVLPPRWGTRRVGPVTRPTATGRAHPALRRTRVARRPRPAGWCRAGGTCAADTQWSCRPGAGREARSPGSARPPVDRSAAARARRAPLVTCSRSADTPRRVWSCERVAAPRCPCPQPRRRPARRALTASRRPDRD